MSLIDLGQALVEALKPPHNGDGIAVYRWRVSVALVIGVMALSQALHVAWACGYLSFIGLSGFASAQDMKSYVDQSNERYSRDLDSQIITMHDKQCAYEEAGNQPAAQELWYRISDRITEWRKLNNWQTYYVLPCPTKQARP